MSKFKLFVRNQMSFFWLPSAWFCGVKVDSLNSNSCTVGVKHNFFNKNPFNSLFWAVQGMAAEMPGGLLLMKKIKRSGHSVAMLLIGSNSSFKKKAVGKIFFTFDKGKDLDKFLNDAIITKKAQTISIKTNGIDENGDVVSEFSFMWSIKLRSKK